MLTSKKYINMFLNFSGLDVNKTEALQEKWKPQIQKKKSLCWKENLEEWSASVIDAIKL